jgi:hypothetical protein
MTKLQEFRAEAARMGAKLLAENPGLKASDLPQYDAANPLAIVEALDVLQRLDRTIAMLTQEKAQVGLAELRQQAEQIHGRLAATIGCTRPLPTAYADTKALLEFIDWGQREMSTVAFGNAANTPAPASGSGIPAQSAKHPSGRALTLTERALVANGLAIDGRETEQPQGGKQGEDGAPAG